MILALSLACTGGPPEPAWLERCDCPAGHVCFDDSSCAPPPAACDAAFPEGECDLDALDGPCELALCGFDTGASYALEAECWTTDDGVERYVTCTGF